MCIVSILQPYEIAHLSSIEPIEFLSVPVRFNIQVMIMLTLKYKITHNKLKKL